MAGARLNTDANGKVIQIFKPKEIQATTNPTTFSYPDYKAVMFAADATVYIGSASTLTFVVPAGTVIGIPDAGLTTTTATNAMLM